MGIADTAYKGRISPPVLHTCDESKGLKCDGMRCFEVLKRKHRFYVETRYWCDDAKGYFDPASKTQCKRWGK